MNNHHPDFPYEVVYVVSDSELANCVQQLYQQSEISVDLEFDKISKIIQAELYNKYQLTSEELQRITFQKSKTSEEYLYVYSKKQKSVIKNKFYFVNCSKEGAIKKVITSK